MKAYLFQAELLCEDCGEDIKRQTVPPHGVDPADPDECLYDSDDYPKGPYSNGGGEADSPQHCGCCRVFLENPLTSDGVAYVDEVANNAAEAFKAETGKAEGEYSWSELADWCDEQNRPAIAEWIRYYLAPGL